MTINDIFKIQMYGEEQVKFETIKESLIKNYDSDTDIFHAAGRIKDIVKRITLTEDEQKIIDHICNKCECVENRLYNEEVMSGNYKKLQALSIAEDCDKIIAMSNKRALLEGMSGKEELAKVCATSQYFITNYLDEKTIIKESTNVQFNRFIKDEQYNIEQVL